MKPSFRNSKTTRLLVSLLVLLFGAQVSSAQQFSSYTQYMNNLTPLNPAASLLDKAGSVSAVLRKQWTGIAGSPSSFMANLNLPFESIGAAGGLTVLNDQFALEHLTEINAFFAKSVELSEGQYLAVSLNAGVRRYTANYSSLDAIDPQFKYDVRETKPNIGFGILYFTDSYYLGVSVPEFTTRGLGTASATNNSNFRSHYNFSGAYLFGQKDDDIRVKPAVLGTYSKDVPFIADFSATMYLKSTIGIGANYRTNNEMAGILSFTSDSFKLGYSYQFGTSSSNVSRGFNNNTHEVTFTYRFGSHLSERGLL
jgi:type IX secretion system PorP/SprF family membrane protein